jgi:putative phosphoesterase
LIVAILGDTHMPRGKRVIPQHGLELMKAADLILHVGDFLTEDVLSEIEALGPPVRAVWGNMDSNALRRRLPGEATVEVEKVKIGLVHDAGPSDGRVARLKKRFPDAAAVVFGHSHQPLHQRDGDFQIFNPGSPTERRRAPHHTIGLALVKGGKIEFELVRLG